VVALHWEEVACAGLVSLLGSTFFGPADKERGWAFPASLLEGLQTKQAVRPLFLAAERSEAQPVLAYRQDSL
tara:strand:+ start:4660 stop:4875 length:216 start_codon:yes stop_codon:yes gene_type:complete